MLDDVIVEDCCFLYTITGSGLPFSFLSTRTPPSRVESRRCEEEGMRSASEREREGKDKEGNNDGNKEGDNEEETDELKSILRP
jgi:hypothetical protein